MLIKGTKVTIETKIETKTEIKTTKVVIDELEVICSESSNIDNQIESQKMLPSSTKDVELHPHDNTTKKQRSWTMLSRLVDLISLVQLSRWMWLVIIPIIPSFLTQLNDSILLIKFIRLIIITYFFM